VHESRAYRTVRVVGLAALLLFTLAPVYVMIFTSLKPLGDVQGPFRWLPSAATVAPFVEIWSTIPLARYFVNSVVVAVCATVLSVVIAIFAAYAMSRYRFAGREVFRLTVLSTQMFPGILFLLPLFLIFVNLGRATGLELAGSREALIITYLTFSLPFSIWMLIGYFESIPRELDEAAQVDGATPIGALLRVVLPAARPGIVAVAIYAFITAWGETLFASVMTTDASRTLAVGLREYANQTGVFWNQIMAASLVVSVPIVIGFLFLQKYLVQGLTAGAIK
jgi:multiple sugar transport system permease protein